VVHARPFSRSPRLKSKIGRYEALSLPAGLAGQPAVVREIIAKTPRRLTPCQCDVSSWTDAVEKGFEIIAEQ